MSDNNDEELSLDIIPSGNDQVVRSFLQDLESKLLIKPFNRAIQRTGVLMYVGALAMSMNAERLIEVQNALLEVLKLCDTSSVMLQSVQSGAVNIVEKLKIAYLYLLDGFPEFAKTDIEAIGKDLKTMQSHTEKTTAATKKLATTVDGLRKDAKKDMNNSEAERLKLDARIKEITKRIEEKSSYQRQAQLQHEEKPGHSGGLASELCSCCPGYGEQNNKPKYSDPGPVQQQPGPTDEVAREEHVQKLEKTREEAELFELTSVHLLAASQILNESADYLVQMIALLTSWYDENKKVVTPNLADNIKKAEAMSEQEQKAYWESMMFKQEVQRFYTRWVALKLYCESTRSKLKQIRSETEAMYVDNPRPREAIMKAWDTAKEVGLEEATEVIRKRHERITGQHRTQAIVY